MTKNEEVRVLHDDLVFLILIMLPVKSLMRFKCVRKSWYALLSNARFIVAHFNRNKNQNQSILVARKHDAPHHSSQPLGFEPLISFLSNQTKSIQNVFLPFPSKFDSFIVYGPCNGILCLQTKFYDGYDKNAHSDRDVALWNPATREFNLLPASQVPRSLTFDRTTRNIGFCYDAKSDDYKVVRIETYFRELLPRHHQFRAFRYHTYMVEVYSLRSNCWRQIKTTIPLEEASLIQPSYRFSSCLNGVQYWQTRDKIVSFDFVEQLFGVIAYPLLPDQRQRGDFLEAVAVLNDSLALIFHRDMERGMDEFQIWVMNEERTWTLHVKLDFGGGHLYRVHKYLVGFSKNVMFFFIDRDGYLCLYDSSTHESKVLDIHCLDSFGFMFNCSFRTVVYEESLVSVKGRIEPLVPAYISLPPESVI